MDAPFLDVVPFDGTAPSPADLLSGLAPGPLIAIALAVLALVAVADLVLPRPGIRR